MSNKVFVVLCSDENDVLVDVFSTAEKARDHMLEYFEGIIQYMEVYEGPCSEGDTAEEAVKKWTGEDELSISGEGIFAVLEAKDVQ